MKDEKDIVEKLVYSVSIDRNNINAFFKVVPVMLSVDKPGTGERLCIVVSGTNECIYRSTTEVKNIESYLNEPFYKLFTKLDVVNGDKVAILVSSNEEFRYYYRIDTLITTDDLNCYINTGYKNE